MIMDNSKEKRSVNFHGTPYEKIKVQFDEFSQRKVPYVSWLGFFRSQLEKINHGHDDELHSLFRDEINDLEEIMVANVLIRLQAFLRGDCPREGISLCDLQTLCSSAQSLFTYAPALVIMSTVFDFSHAWLKSAIKKIEIDKSGKKYEKILTEAMKLLEEGKARKRHLHILEEAGIDCSQHKEQISRNEREFRIIQAGKQLDNIRSAKSLTITKKKIIPSLGRMIYAFTYEFEAPWCIFEEVISFYKFLKKHKLTLRDIGTSQKEIRALKRKASISSYKKIHIAA